ncbi:MAG: hypothetical protein AAFY56_13070, partial [Pseudomonadota bacterium]
MKIDAAEPALSEIIWHRSRHGNLKKSNKPTVKLIAQLIKADDRSSVLEMIEPWAPVDIVQLLLHLPLKRARQLYEWLSLQPAKHVLAEMEPGLAALLMEEVAINRMRELVDG